MTAGAPIERALGRLASVHRSGEGWMAHCPHHDDHHASLAVKVGDDGRVLLHCHKGCSTVDVVVAMGLSWVDLFSAGSRERRRPRTWRGQVPIGAHGRPALQSMGDDVVAAMLGELARIAALRGRLDERLLAGLFRVARACGSSRDAVSVAVRDAVSGDAAS